MKTSLVLTTYNGEKYIVDQLESIRSQTRPLDEVLIFDDRSTDNTYEIVSAFIKNNSLHNWKFIVNELNKGWRRNFMEGLLTSTGDIVFLSDQDDIWMPEKVELMSSAIEETEKIKLLVCDYQLFYSDELPGVEDRKRVAPVQKGLYPNIFNVLYPGCTYCVRKDLVLVAEKYWTEDTAHDELLWRIALFDESLYIYPQKLIYWRRHEDSTWALEGIVNKSLETRIKWTAFASRQVELIHDFLSQSGKMTPEKEKTLDTNEEWIKLRRKLFANKNVGACLKLVSYMKCYNSMKQYFGDIYLTYLK